MILRMSTPLSQDKERKNTLPTLLIIIVLVAAAVVGTFIYAIYIMPNHYGSTQHTGTALSCSSLPKHPSSNSGNATAGNGLTAKFLIVAADIGSPYEGFNGSAYHLTVQWPVMHVHLGQQVVITVMNCASSEPHGFAITHYLDSGIELGVGKVYVLNFTANEKGSFRVYCSILCTVHPYMQNGALIVN